MKYLYLFGLLLLCVFVYHEWFLSQSILTYSDWGFFYNETQKQFLSLPLLWNTDGLGGINIGLSMYPINLLWGVLGYITDFGLAERLLYMYISVIASAFAAYILARHLRFNYFSSFVTGIVYTFNTYFILGRTGHLTLLPGSLSQG